MLDAKGPRRSSSPYTIPHVITNIAAGQIAIAHDLRGPSYANVSACSSSGHAIGEAFEWIRRGRTPLMLAGGAEAAVCGFGIGGFGAMFALSRRNAEPERASRPWDKGRDGFVCGEGAGTLLLESLSHAQALAARRSTPRSLATACVVRRLPHHETVARWRRRRARDEHGAQGRRYRTGKGDVDYLNAHGTSTPQGDIEETHGILRVFGEHAASKKALGQLDQVSW